jgi:ubiquinone/menaquinone biosynthesis C-methylase UbiE
MIDQNRQNVLAIAEAIAPGWERRRPFIDETTAPVREWMIQALGPQPGETLLELAAGAGEVGFAAAARIGETGRLITTDVSPAMLDVARRRGAELGLDNVDYAVMDAEQIELEDESVDGILCRFAYMLMPDPQTALDEARRVLRRGGRLALAVWGPAERNPFFSLVGMRSSSTATSRRPTRPSPASSHWPIRAVCARCSTLPASPKRGSKKSQLSSSSRESTSILRSSPTPQGRSASPCANLTQTNNPGSQTSFSSHSAGSRSPTVTASPASRSPRAPDEPADNPP